MKKHIVVTGDTLNAIAARYGSTAQAIFRASSFKSGNIDLIYPGEVAIIPEEITETDAGEGEGTQVYLEILGRRFTGWSGVNLTRAIDTIASGFSIDAAFNNERDVELFKPFQYQDVKIFIGNRKILTGVLEVVSPSLSDSAKSISLEGRSITGQLVDCPLTTTDFQINGQTLGAIAKTVCSPYSINVVVRSDTSTINVKRPEPEMTVFDFLKEIADANGKLLIDNADGSLVIMENPAVSSPVASFVEGESKVSNWSAKYDGTARFSKYTVLAQAAGNPSIKNTVTDSAVSRSRPFIKVDKDAGGDPEKAAKWQRALAISKSVSVSLSVPGWLNGSRLWREGDTVTARAPSLFIYEETTFLISTVSFRTSEGENSTDLTLVLPETYSSELPDIYPWGDEN